MRAARLCGCLLALSILCAGCGAGADAPAGPLPQTPPEAAAPEQSASEGGGAPVLPEGDIPEGTVVEYTRDRLVTVDGGRELTLRLRCRAEASGYGTWRYGVTEIEVLDGARALQTLSVREAQDEAERQAGLENLRTHTDCWDVDGGLVTEDLNFDGSEDLRLLDSTGVVNSVYLCWLWDPAAAEFCYAFSLFGYDVAADAADREITTESRGGWGQYYTDYYRYDEDGVLRHVKQVCNDYAAEGATEERPAVTIWELEDGEWRLTQ